MAEPFADLTGIHILIVEDDSDGLELLQTVFRSCGAHTVAARNVVTALAFFGTARFDVLVSDLAMPGRDGIDLIRTVRARRGPERTIPAIALTAFYETYDRDAIPSGFDVYLRKPIDLEALCTKVREIAGRR